MVSFSRLIRAVLCALAFVLSACVGIGPGDDTDLTALVRVEPEDLQLRTFVPRGLSDTGQAFLRWDVIDPDAEERASELFFLEPRSGAVSADGEVVQRVFGLQSKDERRFREQQVRQRAQLLSGFYGVALAAFPDLCDEAGVSLQGRVVYTMLSDAQTGAEIAVRSVPLTAAELKRMSPFCI